MPPVAAVLTRRTAPGPLAITVTLLLASAACMDKVVSKDLMAHAGLPGSRLYSGSWSEWCADPARPVARG